MSKGHFTGLRVYACLSGIWNDEETGRCQDETVYFDTEKEALDALEVVLKDNPKNRREGETDM